MFLDANNDLYIIGASDLAGASSLYLLPFPNYAEGQTVLRTGLGRAFSLTKVGSAIFYANLITRVVRRWEGESDVAFISALGSEWCRGPAGGQRSVSPGGRRAMVTVVTLLGKSRLRIDLQAVSRSRAGRHRRCIHRSRPPMVGDSWRKP